MNKQLWTPPYALLNAAMTGSALLLVYVACDVLKLKAVVLLLRPFQWMGMNALLVFVLAASDVFDTVLSAVYVGDAKECRQGACYANLTQWIWYMFEHAFRGETPWQSHGVARVVYVLCKIAFWLAVSGLLHRHRWYWKF